MATDIETTSSTGNLEEKRTAETEEKARRLGWVPKDEFRGSEDRWIPAERFVERGENELPLLRADLKKLHEGNSNLNKRIEEMQGTFKDFSQYHRETEQRSYERAKAEIDTEMRQAATDGNVEVFDKAKKELDELPVPKETPANDPNQPNPTFRQWHPDNSWYLKDVWMTKDADDIFAILSNSRPDLQGIDLYNEVTKEISKKYPEKFANLKREEPDERGGPVKTLPGKKDYASMPQDAKDNCARYVKEGLLKQEEYVKTYWESPGAGS